MDKGKMFKNGKSGYIQYGEINKGGDTTRIVGICCSLFGIITCAKAIKKLSQG